MVMGGSEMGYAIAVWISVSKVLSAEDAVAFAQDFVPLGPEVELLAEVAGAMHEKGLST